MVMLKWQLRSNAFTRRNKPSLSVIEAHALKITDGNLVFLDENGVIVCIIHKDSWNDVVRIP